MMVNVLASVLGFQRDTISENTSQGVAVAETSGKTRELCGLEPLFPALSRLELLEFVRVLACFRWLGG
ncbi:hypothetical protein [Actinomadura algeriensis]|uniref:Resolvase/invertase-type recombinase catalytic domain-containing protein n=1 Tax=Actinomadura algeriensis TaxID=1679523 RepID=A0ABR9K3U8_9ACTN|nr:hypothetical protein [Actinomadura algeriensis]MBE1537030.1 hypothetical protein [Actinomadura algeriensis]